MVKEDRQEEGKRMKKIIKASAVISGSLASVLLTAAIWYGSWLPDVFYVGDPAGFSLPGVRVSLKQEEVVPAAKSGSALAVQAELKLGGIIPVKTVSLIESEQQYLIPGGTPFGLKMLTDGVLVVGLSPIETSTGTLCPAQTAGIRKGDIITAADGELLDSFDELAEVISASEGAAVELTVRREEKELQLSVVPAVSNSGRYQCGIWGRDSSAGIGTMTYYDLSGNFGGLGHGVCDADTESLMPLAKGEILQASIFDIVPGTLGEPGELRGSFSGGFSVGMLKKNTPCGVFGTMHTIPDFSEPMEVGRKQEITPGPAQILTTVQGKEAVLYEIEIEKVIYSDTPTRNMILKVTDPELLALTGGIVQGMSGSPIIQDGKLVGAVTHVLVNDPTRGYGIFIENMLEAAG